MGKNENDEKDERTEGNNEILTILEKDARVSPAQIATMTGLKEADVKEKIKEYEKRNIIQRYKTVINWEKLDKEPVFALVDVNVIPQRERGYDAVAERIMRFPQVRALYLISGTYDLSVVVEGGDMKEVASFVSGKLAPLDQVRGTVTHFIMKRYKEDGVILLDKEESRRLAVSP